MILRKALKILFLSIIFFIFLINLLLSSDDLKYLKTQFEQQIKKDPKNSESIFNLMVVYGALGDLENLYKTYNLLVATDPNFLKNLKKDIKEENSGIFNLYKLAFLYYFLEDYDKSIFYFERLYDLKPDDDWVIAYLAYLYYLKDNLKKTKELIDKGLKLNKDNEFFHALLCALYLRENRYFSALKEYFTTLSIVQRKGYKNIFEILKNLR